MDKQQNFGVQRVIIHMSAVLTGIILYNSMSSPCLNLIPNSHFKEITVPQGMVMYMFLLFKFK